MFFFMPAFNMFFFYVTLAVLPAVLLLIYINRQDKIEKEPMGLLLHLLLMGVLAGFLAMILETVGTFILNLFGLPESGVLYTVLMAFIVVAASEEGAKYFLMHKRVWNNPNFNYRFDGIIYSVFTSLGFAAMENILYGISYGPSVLLSRALLSIPGHMSFGVVFGIYYGRARMQANMGQPEAAKSNIWKGYLLSVFVHGLYDACAMLGTTTSMVVFAVVVIAIYVLVFRTVRQEARTDQPIR